MRTDCSGLVPVPVPLFAFAPLHASGLEFYYVASIQYSTVRVLRDYLGGDLQSTLPVSPKNPVPAVAKSAH